MGKHERKLIEDAEKMLVSLLNKEKIDEEDMKGNPWFEHALALLDKIRADYPNLISAEHIGNRYDNIGDILIKLPDKEVFLEIKMSETKTGKGTEANISQDALTENRLFEDNPVSWSVYRRAKNHDQWVNRLLNRYKEYPLLIRRITNRVELKDEKARYLRSILKKNKLAASIMNEIHDRDRNEKINYLKYLSRRRQNNEMIKRFFILIKMGVHRDGKLRALIGKDNFMNEIKNIYVYYANLGSGGVIITKEDVGQNIIKIIKNLVNFKIIFSEKETHCKIVGLIENKKTPLLQVVYHWKNIAQGIQTPCLNIFDLTSVN